VVEETSRSEPSGARIEKYISSDQALASKVLRVVNSAYYGLSGQIGNIGQAVMILGMQQVRNLVLSMGAISMFDSKVPGQDETIRKFWLHSYTAAVTAQRLGQKKKIERSKIDLMFVSGLLHDIGKLFLYSNFTCAYEQLIEKAASSGISVEMAELMLLGIGHADVGQLMAEYWRLPEELTECVGAHEGPFSGAECATMFCVHIADSLTKHLYYRPNLKIPYRIDPIAKHWLDFTEDEWAETDAEVERRTAEAIGIFQRTAA
jgi:HD-like signal output (HDOD) protein